jgi:ferredoxin-type protein NapG
MACGVGLLGAGRRALREACQALPPAAIRPPGALPEADFSAACIRCGLCVRDCPYDILHLAKPEEPMSTGTPYFVARQAALRDVRGHPLRQGLSDRGAGPFAQGHQQVEDGPGGAGRPRDLPQLPRSALRHLLPGLPGDRQGDHARSADQPAHRQAHAVHARVHSEHCTGCGKCEKACPTQVAAIKVFPLYMAKGQLSSHYRLGWVEKEKAGGSLVAPDVEHRYNMPEGMKYESGKGLS